MKGIGIQLIPDTQLEGILKPAFELQYDNDGKIVSGLVIGPSQMQNEALILASNPGEMKNAPTLGVGLTSAVLSDDSDLLKYRHEARRCYEMDGMEIDELKMFDLDNVEIKAHYK